MQQLHIWFSWMSRSPFDESHKDFLYHLSYQRLIKKHFDQTYIVRGKVTYHSNTLLTYIWDYRMTKHSFIHNST